MISRKLGIATLILLLTFITASAHGAPRNTELRVSTLNLKWFGIGGAMWNVPEQEFRQNNIKRFFDETMFDSDIVVFTEVVVTDTLRDVVKHRMDCVTYEGAWSRHQHVVICFDKKRFRAEKYDADYIIPEVDLGSGGLRPAAQAKICHKKGKCFLQVIGLHLAAGNKTAKRSDQVQFINDELQRQGKMLPTIITGDWNSYITAQTKGDEDDIRIFEKILSKNTRKFKSVTNNIPSYYGASVPRVYDHIVTTSNVKTLKAWGYEACKEKPNFNKKFIPYYSFRRHYTDHCPVTAHVRIKN